MKCEKCGKEIRMMDATNGLCQECAAQAEEKQPQQEKKGIGCGTWCVIVAGVFILLILIISAIGGSEANGEVEAFTFVQMEIQDYLPGVKVSMRDAEIISTGLRYKVEGTFTLSGLKYEYCGIITFDNTQYKACTMNYLQIDDTVLYDR